MNEKIDIEKLKEFKESIDLGQSELEELMKINSAEMTPESQKEFLNLFKESCLYLPIGMDLGGSDKETAEVDKTRKNIGFSIRTLLDEERNKIIPLFTNEKFMEELGFKTNWLIYMDDLADMIRKSDMDYHAIVINPNTEYSMKMDIPKFLNLFKEIFEEYDGNIK